MPEKLKFFSPEWCAAAQQIVNANEAMYKGFKDPQSFTNKMAFTCGDTAVATHIEWQSGRILSWGRPMFDNSDLWLVIAADLETWRLAAEGAAEGGVLLMSGKIKFVQGPMSAAIENGEAFNEFLCSWGQVPTDWNV